MARRASGEYGCSRSTSSNFFAASSNLPLVMRASASANILEGGSGFSALAASPVEAHPASAATQAAHASLFRACHAVKFCLFPSRRMSLLSSRCSWLNHPSCVLARPMCATPSTRINGRETTISELSAPSLWLGGDYGCCWAFRQRVGVLGATCGALETNARPARGADRAQILLVELTPPPRRRSPCRPAPPARAHAATGRWSTPRRRRTAPAAPES